MILVSIQASISNPKLSMKSRNGLPHENLVYGVTQSFDVVETANFPP